jgi:hypothetical protein
MCLGWLRKAVETLSYNTRSVDEPLTPRTWSRSDSGVELRGVHKPFLQCLFHLIIFNHLSIWRFINLTVNKQTKDKILYSNWTRVARSTSGKVSLQLYWSHTIFYNFSFKHHFLFKHGTILNNLYSWYRIAKTVKQRTILPLTVLQIT